MTQDWLSYGSSDIGIYTRVSYPVIRCPKTIRICLGTGQSRDILLSIPINPFVSRNGMLNTVLPCDMLQKLLQWFCLIYHFYFNIIGAIMCWLSRPSASRAERDRALSLLVPEVNSLVVVQMRRLELDHLVWMPSVDLPHARGTPQDRAKASKDCNCMFRQLTKSNDCMLRSDSM